MAAVQQAPPPHIFAHNPNGPVDQAHSVDLSTNDRLRLLAEEFQRRTGQSLSEDQQRGLMQRFAQAQAQAPPQGSQALKRSAPRDPEEVDDVVSSAETAKRARSEGVFSSIDGTTSDVTLSSLNDSSAGSVSISDKSDAQQKKETTVTVNDVQPANDAPTGDAATREESEVSTVAITPKFAAYQGSTPVRAARTLKDLAAVQNSTTETSETPAQSAMVRFQPPQSTVQASSGTGPVGTATVPTDTASNVQPKGRGKRSLDSLKNRLRGLVNRDPRTTIGATGTQIETAHDYAKVLAERDEEISTLKSRIQDANTRAFDLQSTFDEFRQTAATQLSEITDAFKKQMRDLEDKHKAESEEMMGLTRGLRSEIEQLRAEIGGPAIEIDKPATETDMAETIDEADKQIQLFRPETNQSTGDMSTAMTRPSLSRLHHPRFHQMRPQPMPSVLGGLPPLSSYGGFPPFGSSSMMPFHHPAGMLSSSAPPSMGFGPGPFGFGPGFGRPMMFHPTRQRPTWGQLNDDTRFGADSALSGLQDKLFKAMQEARKSEDATTFGDVVGNDGSRASGYFEQSSNGFTSAQSYNFGSGSSVSVQKSTFFNEA